MDTIKVWIEYKMTLELACYLSAVFLIGVGIMMVACLYMKGSEDE